MAVGWTMSKGCRVALRKAASRGNAVAGQWKCKTARGMASAVARMGNDAEVQKRPAGPSQSTLVRVRRSLPEYSRSRQARPAPWLPWGVMWSCREAAKPSQSIFVRRPLSEYFYMRPQVLSRVLSEQAGVIFSLGGTALGNRLANVGGMQRRSEESCLAYKCCCPSGELVSRQDNVGGMQRRSEESCLA